MKLDIISKLFNDGQLKYVDTIKRLLYKKDSLIFEKLDFYNIDVYLNPMLFSYFTNKNNELSMTLEQILNNDFSMDLKINVNSDRNGVIYLPSYGYILNTKENTKYFFDTGNKKLYIDAEIYNQQIYTPITVIEDTEIELCIYTNPYFDKFIQTYVADLNNFSEIDHIDLVNNHKKNIKKALEIIKKVIPDFYNLILSSTKKIFIYDNKKIRSFVTRQCHGAIFLSVDEKSNVTYFLEEILHQCGHNIFNSITFNVNEFLKVPESTLIGSLNKTDDSRTIYSALHGVFTVSTGTYGLYQIYKNICFDDDELNIELLARLAIKSNRFRTGIEKINFDNVFTDKGKIVYDLLDKECEQIIFSNPQIFNKYDFSNQPHVFSYEMFKKIN